MKLTLIARGGVPVKLDRDRVVFFDMEGTWLVVQKYGINFVQALYTAHKRVGGAAEIELKDMEALVFFLWAGLRVNAAELGEELTLEQVREFITPFSLPAIFNAVVVALTRDIETPSQPGKESATGDTAQPAVAAPAGHKGPGPTKVSTSMKRSGGRSGSRAGARKSSGR